ncbi:MAG TPA: cyanoexosortase C, partial [Phormidium sp.]
LHERGLKYQGFRGMIRQPINLVKQGFSSLGEAIKTWHGRFVLAGLSVGLLYLPVWLHDLLLSMKKGSDGVVIIFSIIAIALWQIWPQRHKITQLEAAEADEFLGHLLISTSIVLFPACRFAIWSQSLLWLMALAGIVISTWGAKFFTRYPLISFLVGVTVYPKPSLFARLIWETLTPYRFLDRAMAASSAAALRLIGQPAIAEGSIVAIPSAGAVDVNWDCNGFAMACTIAASGLIMGLLLKQPWSKTLTIMIVGAALGLVFNVPRIMLLTMASVYWGKEAFDFWHSNLGSQIFSGVLLTVYYYATMAIIKQWPTKQTE